MRRIEDVLDDLLPEWREVAREKKGEGLSDAEIVEHFQQLLSEQMDGLLDLWNDLGGKR